MAMTGYSSQTVLIVFLVPVSHALIDKEIKITGKVIQNNIMIMGTRNLSTCIYYTVSDWIHFYTPGLAWIPSISATRGYCYMSWCGVVCLSVCMSVCVVHDHKPCKNVLSNQHSMLLLIIIITFHFGSRRVAQGTVYQMGYIWAPSGEYGWMARYVTVNVSSVTVNEQQINGWLYKFGINFGLKPILKPNFRRKYGIRLKCCHFTFYANYILDQTLV